MVTMEEIQAAYYMVAATGVLIAAVFYIINMKTTIETRQAQLFMQLYDRWTFDIGEKFWNFLDTDIKSAEEYFDRLKKDKEYSRNASILSRYHEGVGVLVRFGLLDIKYIAYLACWPTRMYWEKYKPIIADIRRIQGAPRSDSESEYLYNRLIQYLEQHPELKT